MRPPGPAAILYSIICFSLLHLQRSMASLVPQAHFCDSGICASLPVRRRSVDQVSEEVPPTPSAYIKLPLNSSGFLDRLLDTAPCPPIPRVQLLCESWSTKSDQLTCEERSRILSRCVDSLPVGDVCGVIRKCAFTCKAFGLLRDLHCSKSPSIRDMLTSVSVTTSVIMTTYDVNATNGSDWSATTKSPGVDVFVGEDDGRLPGEVVIVLIAVCVFGFIFLPLVVYYLLNRDNRTVISRCCGAMWSCCTRGLWSWCKTKVCPTHERFTNDDHKKDEVVEEIVAITPMTAVELSPVRNTPARSLTSDSGIGIGFDLDFPEADSQTPDDYRNTPWIQRRSLLVDTDFDLDWSHL
ncbi:uncharacterized protein LOC110456295 [Mizuhopecten yessoensis]|uniref:FZ domain-containing protein n=1 Tax=Mizuhopecten yessoensis TaxID=6573 RepID=A0A210QBB2_MIZYE|nr:uncharacterized protein LOC110456295 [Mizuhopecten yessoensis]XP_021362614.1 uncharacterized protein LOC110456295 [Mizuhopecten yessoensis]XP_021362615.1 uncharacterized protein LOC110456295 [Mizuhopecten yessoensis]XP_021362616.1 uncharacterized protein LOC110456295 [Mizuhopecten yessoensis]XP_021362617.1 uncharacterized protein LOC110456295 [Mizuhopecten yessoensis]OWF46011.1 hypothetical protein KP79_PYT10203 [Mizuhopecten yessoensis]